MALRRAAGAALLVLGSWLAWGAWSALLAYTERGGDIAGYLFEPPTGIIRMLATELLLIGGLLVLLKVRLGAVIGTLGAVFYALLGILMALAGADIGLWLDEILYASGALGLCVLIFSLRRT